MLATINSHEIIINLSYIFYLTRKHVKKAKGGEKTKIFYC